MTSPRGVLVVARDAGAAAALAPVVRELTAGELLRPQIVAWGKALAALEADALPVLAFPEEPTLHDLEAILAETEAIAVLTGTSMRTDLDALYWDAAATAGIPSVALLDHWTNYAERFTRDTPFDALPTAIAVMDDVALAELAARGCPFDRVHVTGQPRFDAIAAPIEPAWRAAARRTLGIASDRTVAVFASEPQQRHYGDSLGYTEADAVVTFLDAVEAVDRDMLGLVKLHPLEKVETMRAAVSGRAWPEARIIRAYPARDLMAAADVFCGMTSIVLLDAALFGVPTVSIRPGGASSHFVDVHAELIESAATTAELRVAIESALERGPAMPPRVQAPGAAVRVVDLVRRLAAGSG